jgi:uncharacterized membrane protein YhaH (DUF805 family)
MDVNLIITNFIEVIKDKYVLFTGRARRQEFWLFAAAVIAIVVAVSVVGFIFSLLHLGFIATILNVLLWLFSLAIFMPSLGLAVRRLHDIGKEWQYLLIALIPLVGEIILIYFFVQEGVASDNAYGPNPKA